MSEDQNALAESLSGDSDDVENGGVGPGDAEEQGADTESQGLVSDTDPSGIKKRLGMQAKKHQREIRALHERISQMQGMMSSDSAVPRQAQDSYASPGQPSSPGMNEQQRIQEAVRMALGMQEEQKRQAHEAQSRAQLEKEYQRLHSELERASDMYEDFDDVLGDRDIPFTDHMRDALLLVPNPGEVAYRLGKNRSELERISKLHPLAQAREVNNLSHSLVGDKAGKSASSRSTPLGSVKPNPVNSSQAITDKTPPSVIRARMKAGSWK